MFTCQYERWQYIILCLLICIFNDDALNDVKYFFFFMKCQIIYFFKLLIPKDYIFAFDLLIFFDLDNDI